MSKFVEIREGEAIPVNDIKRIKVCEGTYDHWIAIWIVDEENPLNIFFNDEYEAKKEYSRIITDTNNLQGT